MTRQLTRYCKLRGAQSILKNLVSDSDQKWETVVGHHLREGSSFKRRSAASLGDLGGRMQKKAPRDSFEAAAHLETGSGEIGVRHTHSRNK